MQIKAWADGPTLVEGARPGTIREGVVVSPEKERFIHELGGRLKLECVSVDYLAK